MNEEDLGRALARASRAPSRDVDERDLVESVIRRARRRRARALVAASVPIIGVVLLASGGRSRDEQGNVAVRAVDGSEVGQPTVPSPGAATAAPGDESAPTSLPLTTDGAAPVSTPTTTIPVLAPDPGATTPSTMRPPPTVTQPSTTTVPETPATQPAAATTTAPTETTSPAQQPRGPGVVELPAHDEAALPAGRMQGTLLGSKSRDGGCVWLRRDDGTDMSIRWPQEIRWARFAPGLDDAFELLDENDQVVARNGDRVNLGGGPVGSGGRLERCQVGAIQPMFVFSVESLGPGAPLASPTG